MKEFKTGDKVRPSEACKKKWQFQVAGVKSGTVLSSLFDGTKFGGFAYEIRWDNGEVNAYRDVDVLSFCTQLENK